MIPYGTHVHKLSHWGWDKMAAIFQTTFSIAFSWMKMYEFGIIFHWSLLLRVKLTIFQHWFRIWCGADQATSHYLKQWWLLYWSIYESLDLNELMMWNPVHSKLQASTNNKFSVLELLLSSCQALKQFPVNFTISKIDAFTLCNLLIFYELCWCAELETVYRYHKISNICRTKSQNLNDYLVLQSSSPNPLKPGVKVIQNGVKPFLNETVKKSCFHVDL